MRTKLIAARKAAKQTEASMARRLGIARAGYAGFEQGEMQGAGGMSEEALATIRKVINNYDEDLFDNE